MTDPTDTLAVLADRLARTQRALDRKVGIAQEVAARGQQLTAEIAELHEQIDVYDKASVVLSNIGDQRQVDAQLRIETLVTQGLRVIFGAGDLAFHVRQTKNGTRSEVAFIVSSDLGDTRIDTDVMDARGGGVAAVCGFLLRLIVLLLSRERQRLVLGLDETLAFLSVEHHQAMARLLRQLADQTNVQIILVTHTPAFAEYADVVYRFDQNAGVTTVTQD